jgi:hypothetical protein
MEITAKLIENDWELERSLHEEKESDIPQWHVYEMLSFLHKKVEVPSCAY